MVQRPNHIGKFVLGFVGYCGLLYTLVNIIPRAWVADPLNHLTAGITGILLSLFGISAYVHDSVISCKDFSIKIILECTALFVSILFSAFLLSYPAQFKQKIQGLLFGLPLLFTFNQIRIVLIFLVGMKSPRLFEYAHVYLGQILMALIVILLSIAWLRMTAIGCRVDSPLMFFGRFMACSSLLFILWLFLDKPFVAVNFKIMGLILKTYGLNTIFPEKLKIYPDTFGTFHFVGFTALVFATDCTGWREKIKPLIAGLLILWVAYFCFMLCKILFLTFSIKSAFIPFIALVIINQLILPFSLWLGLVRKKLFRPLNIYKCPLCHEEKHGLIDHIKSKHGESVLSIKKVSILLKKQGLI